MMHVPEILGFIRMVPIDSYQVFFDEFQQTMVPNRCEVYGIRDVMVFQKLNEVLIPLYLKCWVEERAIDQFNGIQDG